MAKIIKAKLNGKGKRIAVVVSRFNDFITSNLLEGCLEELNKLGVKKTDVTVAWVPGAYEIPVVALKFAQKKDIDAVICLGCVIRGETYHYELVAQGAAQGIARVALDTGKPVIFEVLAVDTIDLAYKRSEVGGVNKGVDAAQAAVETLNVISTIK